MSLNMIFVTACIVVLSIAMWYIHAHSHLQRAWDAFIDSWHKCKCEIHFNNIKLENIRRLQDDSRHEQKEILKYIRRIYRSQSPEQRIRYSPKTPQRRRSDVFVVTPPPKLRKISSTPCIADNARLSNKQISFDGLRLSPLCIESTECDSLDNCFLANNLNKKAGSLHAYNTL